MVSPTHDMAVHVSIYVWYPPISTCCGCGSAWNGTALYRNKNRSRASDARQDWDRAVPRSEEAAALSAMFSENL